MKLRALKCQNCGAPLKLDESQKHITCPYCGITNIVFEEYLVDETTETTRVQKTRSSAILIVSAAFTLILIGVA